MTPPVLSVDALSVRLNMAGETVDLLHDLTFSLHKGETLAVVGESGAGKSMLTRVLAQQLPDNMQVSHGAVYFKGENLLALPAKQQRQITGREITYIPQEPMVALNPVMTIGQQFSEYLQHLGMNKKRRHAETLTALEDVGLQDGASLLKRYPHQLSGGQCQRIMIALAFISQPALVICDEATTALDAVNQNRVLSLIRRCQKKYDTAVLFITHDISLAASLSEQVMVMYAGELMEFGLSNSVLNNPRHPYTQALMQSRPAITGHWQPLIPLQGHMPGGSELQQLKGCRFQSRCRFAGEDCTNRIQPRLLDDDSHLVRCLITPSDEYHPSSPDEEDTFSEHYALGLLGTSEPFLRAENISKDYISGRFARRSRKRALKDVSFTLAPGEFVAVVGESGSGKSTLAHTLMGLEKKHGGQIYLHDKALGHSESEWRRRIGCIQMVFQNPNSALNPARTTASLMTQPMEYRRFLPSERRQRAQALAHAVGLNKKLLPCLPQDLSGGQRQRVNIGRSLCDIPQLLIADEIVSGLDVSVQAQILNLLLRLRREFKISLLLISHDLAVVRYLCSRVLVMHQGEIVESGPPQQVFSSPQHPYTKTLVNASRSAEGLEPVQ